MPGISETMIAGLAEETTSYVTAADCAAFDATARAVEETMELEPHPVHPALVTINGVRIACLELAPVRPAAVSTSALDDSGDALINADIFCRGKGEPAGYSGVFLTHGTHRLWHCWGLRVLPGRP